MAKAATAEFGWRVGLAVGTEVLARDVESILSAPGLFQSEVDHWNVVRGHIEDIYRHAVNGPIDDLARAVHLAWRRQKPDSEAGVAALFLILLDDFEKDFASSLRKAGTKAYEYAESGMSAKEWGNIAERSEEFSVLRAPDLTNAPKEVVDRLHDSLARGLAGKESPLALVRRLNEAARVAKGIEGERVTETEATITIGTAVDAVFTAAGYTHKRWLSQRDDRVRESHENCDKQGWIKLNGTFVNGLKYPGQADAPLEEIVNCRCVLVGKRMQ